MQNKFYSIIKLARLHAPIGYMLSFYPAAFGVVLAAQNNNINFKLILLFLIGSISARSSGCIINDIWDAKYDANVERTKTRPLASDQLTLKEAFIALLICGGLSLIILFSLNKQAVCLGMLAVLMISIYPLFKRFTHFAQVFLGLTFNMGALIGYAAVTGEVSIESLILYLACIFWTLSYDTIYSFMDLQDDKKINVHSLGRLLEFNNPKIWLRIFNFIFISLFLIANNLSHQRINMLVLGIGSLLALLILDSKVRSLNIYNPVDCLKKFRINNIIAAILLLSQILAVI